MDIKPTRNNIIVENPVKPLNSSLIVTEEAKQKYAQEQLKNTEKAKVIAVGPGCVEVKTGDTVKVKSSRFLSSEPLEDGKYLLFTEGDVIAIY
jgi:co-chaperonin GroES (HSP10)|tara:strand:- start:315 stop:593 length:279 start_codon:yes stop_codon:yes gene_type:complete